MRWTMEARAKRVPKDVQGLVPRSRLPNNRFWLRKGVQFERNGTKTVLNNVTMMRAGFVMYMTLGVY